MEKSKIQQALERAYSNPESNFLNPDNHDQVNIALGLFNAELAGKTNKSINDLTSQISGLQYTLSTTMEQQVEKMIKSNKELADSNEKYARWMKWLTITLIFVTLFVGLLQAYVIWKTA